MYLITMRSVTSANKCKRCLNRAGFWCNLRRTPQQISSCGCGYCIEIDSRNLQNIMRLLERNYIPYESIWESTGSGYQEVKL